MKKKLFCLLLILIAAALLGCAEDGEAVRTVESGEDLVIPIAELTTDVRFYPVEVDGMQMEVLAVKDKSGTIRTAFNTCQVCYDSGRGYYKQVGGDLVCQNCQSRFTIEQIEVQSGGCNPWPIFSDSKAVTDDEILISYDFLKASAKIFSNWKGNYQ